MWQSTGTGTKKDIRTLLSTLQNVLWPDSDWKEVPMGELIVVRPLQPACVCSYLPLPAPPPAAAP